MANQVFIGYAEPDRAVAVNVYEALSGAGVSCWFARLGASPREDAGIYKAMEGAVVAVFILTPAGRDSASISTAIELARSRARVIALHTDANPASLPVSVISLRVDQSDRLIDGIKILLAELNQSPPIGSPHLPSAPYAPSGRDLGAAGEAWDQPRPRRVHHPGSGYFGAGGEDNGGGARIGAGSPPISPSRPEDIGASREVAIGERPSPRALPRSYDPRSSPIPRGAPRQRRLAPGPSPGVDAVSFGIAHPAAIDAPSSFIIDAWMFQAAARKDAEERALAAADGDARFRSQGSAAVPRGAKLTITVKVGNWPVTPRRQEVWWTGEIANVSFRVTPDGRMPAGAIDGECRISLGGLRIGFVPFQIAVVGPARPSERLTVGTTVKSAFASYASRDRREVLTRVQGIEKAGIDVFMDIRNLRSGSNFNTELLGQIESSDVLYLFWSRHAAASEWVKREWHHGLETRGIDFIDPVPLADPRKVPPPHELAGAKHFNDWTLAYLEYEKSSGLWNRLRNWVARS